MAQEGIPIELWKELGAMMESGISRQVMAERDALLPYLDQWCTRGVPEVGSAFLVDARADFLNANLGNFIDRIPAPVLDQRGGISWVAITNGEQ